ncbi:hypothetical protein C1646_694585 [Rhizophagus diaphanus]|nr:hypothetical protein C1646_694585 [Rhizophagus diaphanus] [Rhizophagus sp. MUCL 43196]
MITHLYTIRLVNNQYVILFNIIWTPTSKRANSIPVMALQHSHFVFINILIYNFISKKKKIS